MRIRLRRKRKVKKIAPKNILTETDLYTFKGEDGGKSYFGKVTVADRKRLCFCV